MTQTRKEANPMEIAICEAVIIPCVSGRKGHWKKAVSRIREVFSSVQ